MIFGVLGTIFCGFKSVIFDDFCPLCNISVIKVVMVNLIQWFYDIYDCLHSLISLGMRDSGQLNVLCMYRSCFSLRSWIEYSRTRVNAISTNWLFCVLSPKYG